MTLTPVNHREFMIDIETLDTKPSAVVLSVGVVEFPGDDKSSRAHLVLPIQPQLDAGRTIDESTLMWWAQQNSEAFKKAFSQDRLSHMSAFFNEMAMCLKRWQDDRMNIWANGPAFDMVILDDLYRDFNQKSPWRFWEYRDVRTIKELAEIEPDWAPADFTPVPHDPVSDCLWQIELVREARRRLSLGS